MKPIDKRLTKLESVVKNRKRVSTQDYSQVLKLMTTDELLQLRAYSEAGVEDEEAPIYKRWIELVCFVDAKPGVLLAT